MNQTVKEMLADFAEDPANFDPHAMARALKSAHRALSKICADHHCNVFDNNTDATICPTCVANIELTKKFKVDP